MIAQSCQTITLDPGVIVHLRSLTKLNYHKESFVEGAAALGLDDLVGEFKDINQRHMLKGYLEYDMYEKRHAAFKKMMRFAKEHLAPRQYDQFDMCY